MEVAEVDFEIPRDLVVRLSTQFFLVVVVVVVQIWVSANFA